jgi:hypothetical protein
MAPEKKPVNWRAWIVGGLIALVVIVIGYIAPLVRRHRREGRQDRAG